MGVKCTLVMTIKRWHNTSSLAVGVLLLIPRVPRNPDLQSRDTADAIKPFSIQCAR
jgi:hypothetical protein